MAHQSYLERAMTQWLRLENIGGYQREHRFHPSRRWRFDFAWPHPSRPGGVALEVEGGIHNRGRHTRGAGFLKDAEKYLFAQKLGWEVLRVPGPMIATTDRLIYDPLVIDTLRTVLTRTGSVIGVVTSGSNTQQNLEI